jgi:transposase-like protein
MGSCLAVLRWTSLRLWLQRVQHLREQGGNVNAVARVLGKHRTQVVRWLARYENDARAVTDES